MITENISAICLTGVLETENINLESMTGGLNHGKQNKGKSI